MGRRKQKQDKANSRKWYWIAGAAILLLSLALIIFLVRTPKDNATLASNLPGSVTVKQASLLREEGAFILDVRTPEEWKLGHIPGSHLIPLDELESRLDEIPTTGIIVVVCRTDNRSEYARDLLKSAGFMKVTHILGGIEAWQRNGFEIVSGVD